MTKCCIDTIFMVVNGRVKDTEVPVIEADAFVTLCRKNNCGENTSINKGFYYIAKNELNFIKDIVK